MNPPPAMVPVSAPVVPGGCGGVPMLPSHAPGGARAGGASGTGRSPGGSAPLAVGGAPGATVATAGRGARCAAAGAAVLAAADAEVAAPAAATANQQPRADRCRRPDGRAS